LQTDDEIEYVAEDEIEESDVSDIEVNMKNDYLFNQQRVHFSRIPKRYNALCHFKPIAKFNFLPNSAKNYFFLLNMDSTITGSMNACS
jgi:hypothetical protein